MIKKGINEILKDKGLKVYVVARDIGVTPETLRNWKSKRTKPKLADKIRLSEAVGVPVEGIDFK